MARIFKTPRKILCAIDIDQVSDLAIDRALHLACRWGATLTVLHVVDDTGLQTEDFSALARRNEAELTQRMSRRPLTAALQVDVMVTLGNPTERILSRCDRMLVDLLVLGSSERSTQGQRVLGSTVDHVLRRVLQPVITVRNPVRGSYRSVAIATDFSRPSREALSCSLALFPEAIATVVHAYEGALLGRMPTDQLAGPLSERHNLDMGAGIQESIDEFVGAQTGTKSQIETVVEAGTPDVVLRRHVDRSGCELVAVGTHGRTGLRRAMIGSVAERLIATLSCDVLAVRPAE